MFLALTKSNLNWDILKKNKTKNKQWTFKRKGSKSIVMILVNSY